MSTLPTSLKFIPFPYTTLFRSQSLWPLSVCRHSPLFISQILTVQSFNADASCIELGKKVTELIESLWTLSVCRHSPLIDRKSTRLKSNYLGQSYVILCMQ